MLQSEARSVAVTILDDLVEFQIEGPCEDSEAPCSAPSHGAAAVQAPVTDPIVEPEPGAEPDEFQVLPAAEPTVVAAHVAPFAYSLPDADLPTEPDGSVIPQVAPAQALTNTAAEILVLRSLLAECGAVVRWLCTKAEVGGLRPEDIEVARSFLVMAGLPPQHLATHDAKATPQGSGH